MRKRNVYMSFYPVLCIVLVSFFLTSLFVSRSVTVFSENQPVQFRKYIVVDAGHGGVDGGATSCTGVLESAMNLQIALRLNDFLHLLGLHTRMIRTTDISVHTQGETIASKKISDLKERVRLTNELDDAVLVSIHMNHFQDSRYSGAQVFYTTSEESKTLAQSLQTMFREILNPDSRRQIKPANGVYLMQHIQCPGVLIECGFISNPEENAKLNDAEYQKLLCGIIAVNLSSFCADA